MMVTPFQRALVDYINYAYEVDPRWGDLNARAVWSAGQPVLKYPAAGLGDAASDAILSDIVGGDVSNTPIDTSSYGSSDNIVSSLVDLFNKSANTVLDVGTTYYTTQAKLNALKNQAQLQKVYNRTALTSANTFTPNVSTTLLLVALGFGALILMTKK